jgi:hypothetical protein
MKRLIYLVLLAAVPAGAQTFFPMQKGAVLEYRVQDRKGKALRDSWKNERWMRLTVEELWGDSVANVVIENETFERLAKDTTLVGVVEGLSYGDVVVKADEVVFDNLMWTFIPTRFSDYGYDEKYTVSPVSSASLPKDMNVGDSLPNVHYRAIFYEQLTDSLKRVREEWRSGEHSIEAHFRRAGMEPPKTPLTYDYEHRATITGRRVVAMETIETPAGEFECYRVTYKMVGPTQRSIGHYNYSIRNGIPEAVRDDEKPPVVTEYIDYISPEVGLVRRDKLNFRGNRAEETMILTTIKR